jgi:peptidoglycan/LPS O-acetylase OafA/YrhL
MFYALNGWRFIFALMIVWHHMLIAKPLNADLGDPIVTFFFVLSGFLLTLSYRDKLLGGTVSSRDFIIKRSVTVFPLQWLFTILFAICSINVVTYWALPFHLTLTQSLVPLWEIDFTLNTPSWFLSSIFVCYLLTPFIFLFTKKRNLYLLLFVLAVVTWHSFLHVLPDDIGRRWLCYINPLARLQDYGAGILLALYWNDIQLMFKKAFNSRFSHTLLEALAVFIICIALFRFPMLGVERHLEIGSVLLDCFICLFIVAFSMGQGVISKVLTLPIFTQLGKISIAIFMSHTFVLHWAKPLFDMSTGLYVLVVFSTTILLSFLLERYYCTYMKQWFLGILNKKA